ncbi:MAG: hypothetical protein ABJB86_15855 [Bacteroidota bacterium]
MFKNYLKTAWRNIARTIGYTTLNIVGLAIGMAVALLIVSPFAWFLMSKWLQDYPYHTSIHWWVFALVGMFAIIVSVMTVSFQSIKAAMANPVKSLRTE